MGKGTKRRWGCLEKEDGADNCRVQGAPGGPWMVLSTEAFRPDTMGTRNPFNYPEQRNKTMQVVSEELIAFQLHFFDWSRMNQGRWPQRRAWWFKGTEEVSYTTERESNVLFFFLELGGDIDLSIECLLCVRHCCCLVEKTGLGIGRRKGRPGSKHQIKTYIVNYNDKRRVVWGWKLT